MEIFIEQSLPTWDFSAYSFISQLSTKKRKIPYIMVIISLLHCIFSLPTIVF
jgi:hypothetical protein